jgi:hypothetical protein
MHNAFTNLTDSTNGKGSQIPIRPVGKYLSNDMRGNGLKEIHVKLDELSARILTQIDIEQDSDAKNKLFALSKCLIDAGDVVTCMWRKVHE